MEHSIALATETTSGLGYAASSLLAAKGYRQVIVAGRRLAPLKEAATQIGAETKAPVVAPLARWLPSGMAAYAVSPGAATDIKVRSVGPTLQYLLIRIVHLIHGINQTPETATRRYLQASEFGTDVSAQLLASTQGKFTGSMWRRCAIHTFRIAPARKLRGKPSSKPPASTCFNILFT